DFLVRDNDYVPATEFEKELVAKHEARGWEFGVLRRFVRSSGLSVLLGNGYWVKTQVTFCRDPENAEICHLGGPLTFALRWEGDSVLRRRHDNTFRVEIGTAGLAARGCDNS